MPEAVGRRLEDGEPAAYRLPTTAFFAAENARGHGGNRTRNRFRAETPGRRGREGGRQRTAGGGQTASHPTMVPSHFSATPANMRTRAVQGGGRYAHARWRSSIPATSRPLPTSSGGGSWAEPLWMTAHRRIGFGSPPALFRRWEPFPNAMHRVWGPIPTEGVRFSASLSYFRPHPLVPGLFWFRARVILLADGPTRPIQRLPVRGKAPTSPHPEPPLLSGSVPETTPHQPASTK
jgi:hypothetical protein